MVGLKEGAISGASCSKTIVNLHPPRSALFQHAAGDNDVVSSEDESDSARYSPAQRSFPSTVSSGSNGSEVGSFPGEAILVLPQWWAKRCLPHPALRSSEFSERRRAFLQSSYIEILGAVQRVRWGLCLSMDEAARALSILSVLFNLCLAGHSASDGWAGDLRVVSNETMRKVPAFFLPRIAYARRGVLFQMRRVRFCLKQDESRCASPDYTFAGVVIFIAGPVQ